MLYLPTDIPCGKILADEGFQVRYTPLNKRVGEAQCVLLLNLMPEKQACELQIARMMAPIAQHRDIHLIPVKIPHQTYKNTPIEYMEQFYEDLGHETFCRYKGVHLIITGAPLENIEYPNVRYWAELKQIFEWAASSAGPVRTLNLCWAAFAALFYFESVPTHKLASKRFGVFEQTAMSVPELKGMTPTFNMPTSRHIELKAEDIDLKSGLKIVAFNSESGPGVIVDTKRRMTHITGHLEYERERLHYEYYRDLSRQKSIQAPLNYYLDDKPDENNIIDSWQESGLTFYQNFLEP